MKFKKILVFMLALVLFQPFLFACDEETFENTPWAKTETLVEDALAKIEDSKDYMLERLGLPLHYETKTKYKFMATNDEVYSDKIITEETNMLLGNSKEINSVAQIERKKFSNEIQVGSELITYSPKDKHYYYKQDYTDIETGEAIQKYYRGDYDVNTLTFIDILSKTVLVESRENEVTLVEEKNFQDVQYYRLTAQAISQNQGLQVVTKNFKVNPNLINSPNLFEIPDRSMNNVISFNYVFGLTKDNYLKYFALNYDISYGVNEMCLSVSSETNLIGYAEKVTEPVVPADKDLYTVSTFADLARSNDNYIIYKEELGENEYDTITAYNKNGNYSIKIEKFQNKSSLKTDYYFAEKNAEGKYEYFKINLDTPTYVKVDLHPTFMDIDYSKPYFNSQENIFQFGSNEDSVEITVDANGEVFSVSRNGQSKLIIDEFKEGKPNITLYDKTGREPAPEVAPEEK